MKNFLSGNPNVDSLKPSEIEEIREAYLSYFDKQKPRDKAIGYMVVCGGVPSSRLGHIDMLIGCPMGWQLKIGKYAIFFNMNNERFLNAIDGYIKNYKDALELLMRLEEMWKPGEVYYDILPLFRSGRTSDRISPKCAGHIIQKASKEIGLIPKGFMLHQLGHDLILPWNACSDDAQINDKQAMLSFCSA